MHHYPRFAYLWFGARINQRIAAPTKNKAPMTRLSPGLAISVRKNSALMKPGQDQQTAPATAKTMASALIIVATPCPQRPITQPRAARRTYDGADLPKGVAPSLSMMLSRNHRLSPVTRSVAVATSTNRVARLWEERHAPRYFLARYGARTAARPTSQAP
jgi:hypothetical protein